MTPLYIPTLRGGFWGSPLPQVVRPGFRPLNRPNPEFTDYSRSFRPYLLPRAPRKMTIRP